MTVEKFGDEDGVVGGEALNLELISWSLIFVLD